MLKNLVLVAVLGLASACSDVIRVRPNIFREVCNDAALGEEDESATNLQQRVIGPGMQIGVVVNEDSSLNRAYGVPPGCAVDFAGVGRIRVCGLTTEELAAKIKAGLERDFFQQATVEVNIESVLSQDRAAGIIYVLGSVGRPGPMQLPSLGDFTVTKAIIAAGGFASFAKGSNVKIVRYCEDGRKYETFIDVDGIMKTGYRDLDVPLRPNDWVIVPQRMFSFF